MNYNQLSKSYDHLIRFKKERGRQEQQKID